MKKPFSEKVTEKLLYLRTRSDLVWQLMEMYATGIWNILKHAAIINVEFYDRRRYYICLVAMNGFLIYYYVWVYVLPQLYENLVLRLIGSFIFLPLILSHKWKEKYVKYLPLVWHLVILYALPFFFTYMMLKNNGNSVWLASTVVALLVMIMGLNWRMLVIHLSVGVPLAIFSYICTTPESALATQSVIYIPIFAFAFAIGIASNYASLMLAVGQERAMVATGNCIAQEVRTPLLIIGNNTSGLVKYLPSLTIGYDFALRNNCPMPKIRRMHISSIQSSLERVATDVAYSNVVIDILIFSINKENLKNRAMERCSMWMCINHAMSVFPFSDDDRAKLRPLAGDDFVFKGNESLMVNILFNLIRHALRNMASTTDAVLNITMIPGVEENRLVFRNTGRGVPMELVAHVFDRFYAFAEDKDNIVGSGVGLAFCKDVMVLFAGRIHCKSRFGEFTEFSLFFPAVRGPH